MVLFKDEQIFFSSPLSSNDGWVENVVPSLSALAAQSTWQVFGNDHPALGAVFLDFGFEDLILIWSPLAANEDMCWYLFINCCHFQFYFRSLNLRQKLWDFNSRHLHCFKLLELLLDLKSSELLLSLFILELEPSLEATNLGLVGHEFAKSVPWGITIDLDKISEFNILYWYIN